MNFIRALLVLIFLLVGVDKCDAANPPPIAEVPAISTTLSVSATPTLETQTQATAGAKDDKSIPPDDKSLMGRGRRRKRGAVYTRFSTRFQTSIKDQIRACHDWAASNDVEIDPSMIFIDEAVSGKKSRRAGLDRLRAALNANSIDVLIVFMTNRLHTGILTRLANSWRRK